MPSAVDRRPWVVLSKSEALVLLAALRDEPYDTEILQRAIRQVQLQTRWIDGRQDGISSSVEQAIGREPA